MKSLHQWRTSVKALLRKFLFSDASGQTLIAEVYAKLSGGTIKVKSSTLVVNSAFDGGIVDAVGAGPGTFKCCWFEHCDIQFDKYAEWPFKECYAYGCTLNGEPLQDGPLVYTRSAFCQLLRE